MKLLTNANNTNALKIIIASKFSQKDLQICEGAIESLMLKFPKIVPQLVLDSGTHVFSSNAAAKYLFLPTPQTVASINYYLDLEASVIQPMTAFFNLKSNDLITKTFTDVLNKFESELISKNYLAGHGLHQIRVTVVLVNLRNYLKGIDEGNDDDCIITLSPLSWAISIKEVATSIAVETVSVGDIVIWCTLYPLFTDPKLKKQLTSSLNKLTKWFENVQKLPEVQSALKSYPVKEGIIGLETLIVSQHIKAPGDGLRKCTPIKEVDETDEDVTEEEKKSAASAWEGKVERRQKLTSKPVLPVHGERNVLITSALPYVNNVPHLGNIIGCVLSGDVFARYSRLRGYNTLYICGTDEYGTATETKALEEKLTPQEICNKYFKIHESIYKWFNISFDQFGRTSTLQQTETCQDIFKKVYSNGYILSDSVEQLLCENCDRYLADRFVEGICPRCRFDDARGDQCDGCGHLINATELIKPRCKVCQQTPVLRHSQQFFLDLPKIEPKLKEWMEVSSVNWSHNAREISKAWLNDGLKPRCITRDLKWGIPVPLEGFHNKVFYVWFDAPIGYISITKSYTKEWKKWWMPDGPRVDLYQFMAKDNVPFHSVMFPASLLATQENYTLVSYIFATEYLNYEDGKFSKSRGIGVFGNDAQSTRIPADIWRFYLLYVRPETQDSSFSWLDLALKNNSELLSIFGNFINRALVFCKKNHEGKVPRMSLLESDLELLALVNRELTCYIAALEKGKLREGIRHMLSIARLGNQFMQSSQPWVLCKGTDDDKNRCGTVIGLCINLCCLLYQLSYPYMPETASIIRSQLNSPPELNVIEDKFRMFLPAGHKIGEPNPLFQKIESDHIMKLKGMFSGQMKKEFPPPSGDGGRCPKIKRN